MSLLLRQKLVEIARQNVGKTEVTRNQASWIKPLWTATNYPSGHDERQPYCAAGMCWALREWLKDADVLDAMGMSAKEAELWRCKYASCYKAPKANWIYWAGKVGAKLLPPDAVIHTGDFVVYKRSHIELAVGDTGIEPRIKVIGYNTSGAGFSRDGEGCAEKIGSRNDVLNFIRVMD